MHQPRRVTQGRWMADNLERIGRLLSKQARAIRGAIMASDREYVRRRVQGAALEVDIAGEFTSIGSFTALYRTMGKSLEDIADELERPVAQENLAVIGASLEQFSIELGSLASQEREQGSTEILDPETARMTLFESFQS